MMTKTRDADVLVVLAFLQRLEIDRNNGRKRGRTFIDVLVGQLGTPSGQPAKAEHHSLIVT